MVKDKLEEILNFFEPVQLTSFADLSYLNDKGSIGSSIINNSDLKPISSTDRFEIAIIFINRFLSDNEKEEIKTAQLIREEIYKFKNC